MFPLLSTLRTSPILQRVAQVSLGQSWLPTSLGDRASKAMHGVWRPLSGSGKSGEGFFSKEVSQSKGCCENPLVAVWRRGGKAGQRPTVLIYLTCSHIQASVEAMEATVLGNCGQVCHQGSWCVTRKNGAAFLSTVASGPDS